MRARQPVKGQRFADVGLDPVDPLRVPGLPFADPRRQVALGLLEVAPVVNPAQFLEAIVVGLARQIVQRVAQEMRMAALPRGFRRDRFPEPGMIVGNNTFDARQTAFLQAQQEVFPTALSRFAILTASACRSLSQLMPMAISTAWRPISPLSGTCSWRASRIR